MKFILDENFPRPVFVLLEHCGHTAQSALEFLSKGSDDTEVFRVAQAILVTTDKDFFHTVPLLHKEHVGVIVIALHQPNRQKLLNRFEMVTARGHYKPCAFCDGLSSPYLKIKSVFCFRFFLLDVLS